MKVSAVEIDVRFQKDLVSFERVELAPQGKADGVNVTSAVEDDPANPKDSILRIKAETAQSFGSGAVADLFFKINPKAKAPGKKEPLPGTSHVVAKFTASLKKDARVRMADGRMAAADGRDGAIDITDGVALFGCFFYMH